MNETTKYMLALSLTPYLGPITARRLIDYYGKVEDIFQKKKSEFIRIPGFGSETIQKIDLKKGLEFADDELRFCTRNSIEIIAYNDPRYPKRLTQCPDAPLVIFVKGNVEILKSKKSLAIVGTRHATHYGKAVVEKIVDEIHDRGHQLVVVSGLAYGIDSIAHRSALKHKLPTIAVLGHGLDKIYPAQHKSLADEILRDGGVILTEFGHKTSFEKANFIRRNRIIAGLSDAVLIAESGITGGALITAEYANNYNRDVFAIPGKVDDEYSAGCNALIKKNKAALCETFQDIEYLMQWNVVSSGKIHQPTLFPVLTDEEETVLELFDDDKPVSVDYLSVQKISSILLEMEFKGLLIAMPGNQYRKL